MESMLLQPPFSIVSGVNLAIFPKGDSQTRRYRPGGGAKSGESSGDGRGDQHGSQSPGDPSGVSPKHHGKQLVN